MDNEYGPGKATKWTLDQDFLDQLEEARESAVADYSSISTEPTHILSRNIPAVVEWVRRVMIDNQGLVGPRPCRVGVIKPVPLPSSEEVEAIMGFSAVAA